MLLPRILCKTDYVQIIVEALPQFFDFQRGSWSGQVPSPEMRLTKSEIYEDPTVLA